MSPDALLSQDSSELPGVDPGRLLGVMNALEPRDFEDAEEDLREGVGVEEILKSR